MAANVIGLVKHLLADERYAKGSKKLIAINVYGIRSIVKGCSCKEKDTALLDKGYDGGALVFIIGSIGIPNDQNAIGRKGIERQRPAALGKRVGNALSLKHRAQHVPLYFRIAVECVCFL
jgi:hypothetical protein